MYTDNTFTNNTAGYGKVIYYENSANNNVFNSNTPANFIIEDNVIKLNSTDDFITIGDFTIIADDTEFHGTGSLDAYTIPSDSKNVKLILNGTDSKVVNNIFILREQKKEKEDIIITIDPIQDVKYKDNVTISGKITSVTGKGLYNINAIIEINGKSFKAKTDKSGAFTLSKMSNIFGINNVTVSYAGNSKYEGNSIKTTFNVVKQDIVITIDPIQDAKYKDNVIITGKITDVIGNGLSNINAIIVIKGKSFKAKTDKTGAFSISITNITYPVGINNVTVSYAGNSKYEGNSTETTFNVVKQDINITINKIPETSYNDNVTISGKIIDVNGNSLSNVNALIKINGILFKAKTDKTGAYVFTTPATKLGTNKVKVGYAGNKNYNSFESVTTFVVISKK
jgi:uncharacterized protein YfaP (DUF2135 family)